MDDWRERLAEAFLVETEVRAEKGQWVAYLDVLFLDRAVHHRIAAYRAQRQAEIAAHWIKRGAARDLRQRRPATD